ncbi:MAG TPA: relaxase/mobilization nuclease domain-containing protein [Novosphingobium sp.]|nr:relaxase/mobilization nuclease domain-containing protein [Novosphingobium sp.]
MILKAKTRGDAAALGRYLLDKSRNEQVEVHAVDGFAANDVMGAMRETDAVAKGIRSRQYLFSVSLSPPPEKQVGLDVFDDAIRRIKERVGLSEQPHIAVFHENGGRRHCHLVVNRINPETMTVIPLPYFKDKLKGVSKDLYVEHGWDLPRGFIDKAERDPRNFSWEEWVQSKRMGRDLRHIQTLAAEAWATADNPKALTQALEARGLYLARGDRRSHVVMSWQGEIFSLPKLLGRKTKEIRERLGSADDLRSTDETRTHVSATVEYTLRRMTAEAERAKAQETSSLDQRRDAMKAAHVRERERLSAGLEARRIEQERQQSDRLRNGFAGLWDRLRGERAKTVRRNEMESLLSMQQDRARRDALVSEQLAERRSLQREIMLAQSRYEQRLDAMHRELAEHREWQIAEPKPQREHTQHPPSLTEQFRKASARPPDQHSTEAPRFDHEPQPKEPTYRPSPDLGYEIER